MNWFCLILLLTVMETILEEIGMFLYSFFEASLKLQNFVFLIKSSI